ncbi:hypothetical protein [Alkalicoccobacillus murimartini]|uniref:Uncharacterized protein n=1 Tax=Alkalicoccobacillus murimartini TaxID=171685 RepID=A0ABT9YF31_9BACI|nr:hypothetical protein [Alkalicoccobacillus murimartini]MDQ0206146.1 hypothetical protein [Alkalicoccobacillus murimartini]
MGNVNVVLHEFSMTDFMYDFSALSLTALVIFACLKVIKKKSLPAK